jgi:hypothetical protein
LDIILNILMLDIRINDAVQWMRPICLAALPPTLVFAERKGAAVRVGKRYRNCDKWVNSGGKNAVVIEKASCGTSVERRGGHVKRAGLLTLRYRQYTVSIGRKSVNTVYQLLPAGPMRRAPSLQAAPAEPTAKRQQLLHLFATQIQQTGMTDHLRGLDVHMREHTDHLLYQRMHALGLRGGGRDAKAAQAEVKEEAAKEASVDWWDMNVRAVAESAEACAHLASLAAWTAPASSTAATLSNVTSVST